MHSSSDVRSRVGNSNKGKVGKVMRENEKGISTGQKKEWGIKEKEIYINKKKKERKGMDGNRSVKKSLVR